MVTLTRWKKVGGKVRSVTESERKQEILRKNLMIKKKEGIQKLRDQFMTEYVPDFLRSYADARYALEHEGPTKKNRDAIEHFEDIEQLVRQSMGDKEQKRFKQQVSPKVLSPERYEALKKSIFDSIFIEKNMKSKIKQPSKLDKAKFRYKKLLERSPK